MDRNSQWPAIDSVYTDEYGQVDPEVYNAAGTVWPRAEQFALSVFHDQAAGLQLMVKAVGIVSRRRRASDCCISNLRSYVFQVYKHLVLAELRKLNRRRELDTRWEDRTTPVLRRDDDIDRRILLEELCRRMDAWTRHVYELRVLGYTFDTIGETLGMGANHVRSEFSKRLARLRETLNETNSGG
jgi:DNA-directed RNA polymerase specialized sigma24 family protein